MNSKTKASRIQISLRDKSLNFVQDTEKSIVLTGLCLPAKLGVITFPCSDLLYLFWKENKWSIAPPPREGGGLVTQVEWSLNSQDHIYTSWPSLSLSLCQDHLNMWTQSLLSLHHDIRATHCGNQFQPRSGCPASALGTWSVSGTPGTPDLPHTYKTAAFSSFLICVCKCATDVSFSSHVLKQGCCHPLSSF